MVVSFGRPMWYVPVLSNVLPPKVSTGSVPRVLGSEDGGRVKLAGDTAPPVMPVIVTFQLPGTAGAVELEQDRRVPTRTTPPTRERRRRICEPRESKRVVTCGR